MESPSTRFPSSAIAAAACVLSYSFLCWGCGVLLVVVLRVSREKTSYVLLFAIATTCSTTVNIIQQCNYLANWHSLRVQQYKASVAAYDNPTLAFGPLSRGFNEVLFWIVLYFYNVDAMLMMFWAIALALAVWNWRLRRLQSLDKWLGTISKVAAFVLPAIMSGLRKALQLHATVASSMIVLNILLLVSFTFGGTSVLLILIRYLRSRLGMGSYAGNTGSAPPSAVRSGTSATRNMVSNLRMRVDPWLVLRFSIAFFILTALEVFLIFFEIRRYQRIQNVTHMTSPDFSAQATITDILNYIPGATASLLAFLLFGTTAHLREIYLSKAKSVIHFKRDRPSSTRVDGAVEDWDRMTSKELPEAHRYRIRDGRLESIELSPSIGKSAYQTWVTVEAQVAPVDAKTASDSHGQIPQKIGVLEDCEDDESMSVGPSQGV